MTTDDFFASVRRWAWPLALTTVIAAAVGFFLPALVTGQRYQSTVTVLVGPVSADADTLRASAQLTATYAELVGGSSAVNGVARTAGVDARALADSLDVASNVDTRLVSVTVHWATPAQTRQIAGALATYLSNLVGSVDPASPGAVTVVSPANDVTAVPRHQAAYAVLAAIAAFALALGLLLVRDRIRDVPRRDSRLAEVTGLQVLGHVPASRAALPVVQEESSGAAGAYRLLTARLLLPAGEALVRNIAVTPVSDSTATGQVAANIAASLAANGQRVLLVGRDGGATYRHFGVADEPRGGALIIGSRGGAITATEAGLHSTALAGEPMSITGAATTLQHLDASVDAVVCATAPVNQSTGSLNWTVAADAVIVVADSGHSTADELRAAADAARLSRATLVGVVTLDDPREAPVVAPKPATPARREAARPLDEARSSR